MSFLYPLLWLGVVGVAAPLWLHLRQRPAKNVVPFSALQFLYDQPRPQRQPLRLRDVLLLLLRSAALVCLVAGFAWPYRSRAARSVSESRVHVLDATLSQRADDTFVRDRERLLAALAEPGRERQDAVIVLGAQPRLVGGFGDARAALLAKVKALAPTYERGSYLEALRLASALLERSLGETRRIVVYGDGQENQWSENENTAPFLRGVDVALASRPAAAERPNLWLAEPSVQRSFQGDKAFVELAVVLGRQGPAREARIVIRADGREILKRSLEFTKDQGALTLAARWESPPTAWVRGQVVIDATPDALDADNTAWFALPPVVEGNLAVLAQSPYLRTALAPDVMQGRWAARWLEPWKQDLGGAALPDVLMLEASYLQSQQVRELVLRALNNGRGVVLTLERVTPLVKGFLRELGFEPLEAALGEARPAAFRYVAAEHPMFKPFLSPDFGNLLEVRVMRHARVRATGALPLLFSNDGDGLVFEGQRTRGRLIVFAFGFERSQTNWPLDPSFVPFLDLCLQHARGAGALETSFHPGEVVVRVLPPDLAVARVALRDAGRVLAETAVEGGRAALRMPGQPGLYTLTYDADLTPRAVFSVNTPPRESQLRYVAEPAALKAWHVADDEKAVAGAAAAATAQEAALQSAAQQRLWWWLLAAAVGLLALETTWIASRREAA